MKFSSFLYFLGLRPLTAELLYDEFAKNSRKGATKYFEDTVVPSLLTYGSFLTSSVYIKEQRDQLEQLLTKANIPFEYYEPHHTYRIWLT